MQVLGCTRFRFTAPNIRDFMCYTRLSIGFLPSRLALYLGNLYFSPSSLRSPKSFRWDPYVLILQIRIPVVIAIVLSFRDVLMK